VTDDEGQIRQLIARFANSFDLKAWDALRECLAESLRTDYSDLRGSKPEIDRAPGRGKSSTLRRAASRREPWPSWRRSRATTRLGACRGNGKTTDDAHGGKDWRQRTDFGIRQSDHATHSSSCGGCCRARSRDGPLRAPRRPRQRRTREPCVTPRARSVATRDARPRRGLRAWHRPGGSRRSRRPPSRSQRSRGRTRRRPCPRSSSASSSRPSGAPARTNASPAPCRKPSSSSRRRASKRLTVLSGTPSTILVTAWGPSPGTEREYTL